MEDERMTDIQDSVAARNLMRNLSSGAIEPMSFGGALLEQVIDGAAGGKETAKVQSVLSEILEHLRGQNVRFVDIIDELGKEVALREEIKVEMGKIAGLLEDPENGAISERLVRAVESMGAEGMVIHNLPYRSMGGLFKGRENELEKLFEKLESERAVLITQPHEACKAGGLGKTRLAVEYGWRAMQRGRYWGVFFVYAESQGDLNRNLAGLAGGGLLNLAEHKLSGQPETAEAAVRELERRTDWLLIFDNVDLKDVAKRLSEEMLGRLRKGHVLITSCLSAWPGKTASVQVDRLDEADAVGYLLERTANDRRRLDDDAEVCREVVQKAGGNPAVLEQAACYINRCHTGFRAFLTDFAKSEKKVVSRHGRDLPGFCAAAMLEAIKEMLGPKEQVLLRLASFFSTENIPVSVFEEQDERVSEALWLLPRAMREGHQSGCDGDKYDVRALLGELARWSLISVGGESFSIHRLIQEGVKLGISKSRQKFWIESALGLMEEFICRGPRPDDVRGLSFWDSIESHVRVVVSSADRFDISEPTSRLMNELGLYLKSRGRFSEAELLYLWALEIDEKRFGAEHPKVAVRLNNLAQVFEETERFEQAEFLMERALRIDESWFGPEHPKVAVRLNNLAELLRSTNQLEQAESLLRRGIEILDKNGGERLEYYSGALSNLAQLLKAKNRLEQAEPLMRKAVEIDEKTLGADHPKVAVRLNNLARLLKDMNRAKEAEPLMRLSLAIEERTYGPDHPAISVSLNNLAQLLKAMNRLSEAERFMRRALEIDEKCFGPKHAAVAVRLNNLAQLFMATRRFEQAESLMRRALEIDEELFGPSHPRIAVRLNNLAGLLESTERPEQAEVLLRRAVEILEHDTGGAPGRYAAALNNLAQLLKAGNRLDEARSLMERSLEIDEGLFGPNHPNVAFDLNNLAELLKDRGHCRKARAYMRRALEILEGSLGPEHPKSRVVQRNLEAFEK
jgi:tetratricopeptide (TPR) repeat protein